MSQLTVNPNRMELRKIRAKLKTAQKGHRLLKDKTNELIRNFYVLIKQTKQLRMDVEKKLKFAFDNFESAKARLTETEIQMLFSLPSKAFDFEFGYTTKLSVQMPTINLIQNEFDTNMPYSPLSSTTKMDKAVSVFYDVFPDVVKLSEMEKSAMLLADEIEKCKRRVNALENVLIPKYEKIIKDIEFKLSENERSTTAKLMKVKTMIVPNDEI